MSPGQRGKQHFISLKWKMLGAIILLAVLIDVTVIGWNYQQLNQRFEDRQQAVRDARIDILSQVLTQSGNALEQLGDVLPVLIEGDPRDPLVADRWLTAQLEFGLAHMQIYAPSGPLLPAALGRANNLAQLAEQTMREERPFSLLSCGEPCLQYRIVPFLSGEEGVHALVLGTSLVDVILRFPALAAADIAVLADLPPGQRPVGDDSLVWGRKLAAISEAPVNAPLLRTLASQTRLQELAASSALQIGEKQMRVTPLPLAQFGGGSDGLLVMLSDVTAELAAIRRAVTKELFFGLLAMAFTVSLLMLLLWRPVSRLRRLSNALPLLANSGFDAVRNLLGQSHRQTRTSDEIDLLDASAWRLSGQLENLEKEVAERAEALRQQAADLARTNEELRREMTERARAEKTVRVTREANTELETAVEQLKRTQAQLVQTEKMASLGGLVAGVAHEINTPVGIGVTAASVLHEQTELLRSAHQDGALTRRRLEDYLSRATESSAMILSNLQRASELIESFKQVAVDQSSGGVREIDLHEYVAGVLRNLKPRLADTQLQLRFRCAAGLQAVTDPGTLSQVLTNLFMNAVIHAYPNGGEGVISLFIKAEGERIQLVFQDDGCGIPKADCAKLFDPFFTTRRGSGATGSTGLGMHVVYNLVTNKLQGRIQLRSEVGKGTRFLVDIPQRMGQPKAEPA